MRIRAGVGRFEAGDEPQRRGLAGARRPEQHDELAVADRQRQVGDRLRRPEALGDVLSSCDLSHDGASSCSARADGAARLGAVEQRQLLGREVEADGLADSDGHVDGSRALTWPCSVLTVTICVVPRYSVP